MGRNAARRREAASAKPKGRAIIFETSQTRTMSRLRAKMKQVRTRVQFERIVHGATNKDATRKLLEPMLPDDLPCCARFVAEKVHTTGCPAAKLAIH